MQIFALSQGGQVTAAEQAERGVDYSCRECGALVRLRGGGRTQKHFYHLRRTAHCRQSGKSLTHMRVQERLHALLPETHLEYPFPTLGRVADVFCPPRNLIFEVQCSPIPSEEIAARNADYASLGLDVVWILHDRRFNRNRVTSAEHLLWDRPYCYTNIDAHGRGYFYQQAKVCRQGRVMERLARSSIDLREPLAPIHDSPLPAARLRRPFFLGRAYRTLFYLLLERLT